MRKIKKDNVFSLSEVKNRLADGAAVEMQKVEGIRDQDARRAPAYGNPTAKRALRREMLCRQERRIGRDAETERCPRPP